MKRERFNNLRYRAIFRSEPEGGFTVIVPSLSGCVTYGENLGEAKNMAREAIELYLEDMVESGESLPRDDESYLGEIEVTVPTQTRTNA